MTSRALSGDEIARTWYDRTLVEGVGRVPGVGDDYCGMRLGTGTVIWCCAWWDMDYEEAFLLEVRTTVDDEHGHTEVVDYLACWSHHGPQSRDLDVEWYGHPRLFFDRDGAFHKAVHHWFVDVMYGSLRDLAAGRALSDADVARLRARHDEVVTRDRARARSQGVRFELPDLPGGAVR